MIATWDKLDDMNRDSRRVGLVFGHGLAFYRGILRGIKSFAETRPDWVFAPIAPEADAVQELRPFALDGLIAHVFTARLGRALERLGKPVVNVSGVLPDLPFPRVVVDHVQVGRAAAEHLLDRGLRRFGFVGYADHDFSLGREAGFREVIERSGGQLTIHRARAAHLDPTGLWQWDQGLERWLGALERPIGVLASHDIQGVQVSEACRRLGLKIPDDVALVGVDDDDLLCEMARPALSSVRLPAMRIGFEAATILDRLMARPGRPARPGAFLLAPLGVAARGSSDLLAIDDVEVAAAARFIRTHALEPIQVRDVVAVATVSRRSLERRFQAILGRGLWEEIRRVRMDRARELLAGTETPIGRIAVQAGFSEAKLLSTAFRQETGMTPSEYRRRHRPTP